MTYNHLDVVVVPFPFTDKNASKRRPAIILSIKAFQAKSKHSVLLMITSSENTAWPMDFEITDLESAGLPAPSKIRMKFFTLDDSLIIRKLGTLGKNDKKTLKTALQKIFEID